jgi:hypothetical protein
MKRIIMMLALAALLVVALSMSALSAFAAPTAPEGCEKIKGQWVCTTVDVPGKSEDAAGDPDPGGTVTNTKKTQGNLENTNPEPQDVGTTCTGPPGRCK